MIAETIQDNLIIAIRDEEARLVRPYAMFCKFQLNSIRMDRMMEPAMGDTYRVQGAANVLSTMWVRAYRGLGYAFTSPTRRAANTAMPGLEVIRASMFTTAFVLGPAQVQNFRSLLNLNGMARRARLLDEKLPERRPGEGARDAWLDFLGCLLVPGYVPIQTEHDTRIRTAIRLTDWPTLYPNMFRVVRDLAPFRASYASLCESIAASRRLSPSFVTRAISSAIPGFQEMP